MFLLRTVGQSMLKPGGHGRRIPMLWVRPLCPPNEISNRLGPGAAGSETTHTGRARKPLIWIKLRRLSSCNQSAGRSVPPPLGIFRRLPSGLPNAILLDQAAAPALTRRYAHDQSRPIRLSQHRVRPLPEFAALAGPERVPPQRHVGVGAARHRSVAGSRSFGRAIESGGRHAPLGPARASTRGAIHQARPGGPLSAGAGPSAVAPDNTTASCARGHGGGCKKGCHDTPDDILASVLGLDRHRRPDRRLSRAAPLRQTDGISRRHGRASKPGRRHPRLHHEQRLTSR